MVNTDMINVEEEKVNIENQEYTSEIEKLQSWQGEAESLLGATKAVQQVLLKQMLNNPNYKTIESLSLILSTMNTTISTGIRSTDSIISAKSKVFNQALKIKSDGDDANSSIISNEVLSQIIGLVGKDRSAGVLSEPIDITPTREEDELDLVINDLRDSGDFVEEDALNDSMLDPHISNIELEGIISESHKDESSIEEEDIPDVGW